MRIALSGVPGVGKTTLANTLMAQYPDIRVHGIAELAGQGGCTGPFDEEGMCFEIDTECLAAYVLDTVPGDDGLWHLVDGHLSHYLPVDMVMVLRVSPSILEPHLVRRGYPRKKIIANLEAEALDLITIESLEAGRETFEIDASLMNVDEVTHTARRLLDAFGTVREAILNTGVSPAHVREMSGVLDAHRPGGIDWSGEIMKWY